MIEFPNAIYFMSLPDLDWLYGRAEYESKFNIMTKGEIIHTVTLEWEDGRSNNYRFNTQDFIVIWPEDVIAIEDLTRG